jgi:hypothetical protein
VLDALRKRLERWDRVLHYPGDYFIFGEKCGMFGKKSGMTSVICDPATQRVGEKSGMISPNVQVRFLGLPGGSTPPISDNQDSVGAVDAYGPQNCRERSSELDRSLEENPVCLEKNPVCLEKNPGLGEKSGIFGEKSGEFGKKFGMDTYNMHKCHNAI